MTIDNIDEMYEALRKYKQLEEELHDYVFKYIKNKSFPLEDRWKLFVDTKKLFPTKSWLIYYKEFDKNNINYYEDFGYERREVIDVGEMVEFVDEGNWAEVNLDNLKEEILEQGYSGFRFDW